MVAKTTIPQSANKLAVNAVASVKSDWCKDYFGKSFKEQPDEIFAEYYHGQDEDTLKARGLKVGAGEASYRKQDKVPISKIALDKALMSQDRRDLDPSLVRIQTLQSFMKNSAGVNAPAVVLREVPGEAYDCGSGRHRLLWSIAKGNKYVNAWIVVCSDEVWKKLCPDFNEKNGAQSTEEERLHLAYQEWLRGTPDGRKQSQKEIALTHGFPLAKFAEFVKQQKACTKATQEGLTVQPGTPSTLVEAAVKVVKEQGIKSTAAQKVLDAAVPPQNGKAKVAAKKSIKELTDKLRTVKTDADVEKIADDIVNETKTPRRRGQTRAYRARIVESISKLAQWIENGAPEQLGITAFEIPNLRKKITSVLTWLESKQVEAEAEVA